MFVVRLTFLPRSVTRSEAAGTSEFTSPRDRATPRRTAKITPVRYIGEISRSFRVTIARQIHRGLVNVAHLLRRGRRFGLHPQYITTPHITKFSGVSLLLTGCHYAAALAFETRSRRKQNVLRSCVSSRSLSLRIVTKRYFHSTWRGMMQRERASYRVQRTASANFSALINFRPWFYSVSKFHVAQLCAFCDLPLIRRSQGNSKTLLETRELQKSTSFKIVILLKINSAIHFCTLSCAIPNKLFWFSFF